MTRSAPDFGAVFAEDNPQAAFVNTGVITQGLQKDIIEFLSAKYTANATITVAEVMKFYSCPPDRARRVLEGLMAQGVLVKAGPDQFRVDV